jgi:hypothetical protein
VDLALLDGAVEVDVLDLLAQIGRRGDEPDVTVLDLEVDVGAVQNVLLDGAGGFDPEGFTAAGRMLEIGSWSSSVISRKGCVDIRFGRIRRQDHLLYGDDVPRAISLAELERVLAGNVQISPLDQSLVTAGAVDIAGVDARGKSKEKGGEPHGDGCDKEWCWM